MKVIEIITKYLIENNFDGLYDPSGECACEIDDLQPCGEDISYCRAGYKILTPDDPEYNYRIQEDKPNEQEDPS